MGEDKAICCQPFIQLMVTMPGRKDSGVQASFARIWKLSNPYLTVQVKHVPQEAGIISQPKLPGFPMAGN